MIKELFKMTDRFSFGLGKGHQDKIGSGGYVKLDLFNPAKSLIDHRETHNTVTTLCHKMAADQLLASPAVATPGWMEVGTGTGQDAADSTLAAYIADSRTALDSKTRGSNAIITMVCTLGAGVGTGAITEAGVFNVVTQNTTDLLLYASFAAVNKAAGDTLVITWTLTFA
jgi:hypothetical protein